MGDPEAGQPRPRKGQEQGGQGQEAPDTRVPARGHHRASAPHRSPAFRPHTGCLFTGCVTRKHLGARRDPGHPGLPPFPPGLPKSKSYKSQAGPAHLPGPQGHTRAFRSSCLGPDIQSRSPGPQGEGQGHPEEGLGSEGRGWGPADTSRARHSGNATGQLPPEAGPSSAFGDVLLSCPDGQLPSSHPTTQAPPHPARPSPLPKLDSRLQIPATS